MSKFSDLIGKTILTVDGTTKGSEEISFTTQCGKKYRMQHEQDCCESVVVEDVCGDIDDLIGSPIVKASEDSNQSDSDYNIATAKGHVTIRWHGESNGYYSEDVDFIED